MGPHLSTRTLLFAFASLLHLTFAAQTCYFPDGSESGDTPCTSSANAEVFCCPSGTTCVGDPGPLCKQSNGDFVRGSCTVQDWNSGACPLFCLGINSDNPIDQCTAAVSQGNFCCGYDADKDLCDCSINNNTFYLGTYTAIELIGISTTASSASSTQSASSTTSFSSTTTAPSAAEVTTGSATTTASGTSTATPTPSSSSSGLSTGAKVGLGIAIPLGLALIGVLGWYLWRRSRTPTKQGAVPIPASELHGQGVYPVAPQPHYPMEPKQPWTPAHGIYAPTTDGSGTLYYPIQTPDMSTMHELPAHQRER